MLNYKLCERILLLGRPTAAELFGKQVDERQRLSYIAIRRETTRQIVRRD